MRLKELIEQHRVDCFVANGVRLAMFVTRYQVGSDLSHILCDEAKLRNTLRIQLFFVAEGDRSEREDSFARLLPWLDLILVAGRGGDCAEVTIGAYDDRDTIGYRRAIDPGDIGGSLSS